MYCKNWTKQEARFIANRKDMNSLDFLINIELLPQNPEPKKVIIEHAWGRKTTFWELSWDKFLSCSTLGNLALIPKTDCKQHQTNKP